MFFTHISIKSHLLEVEVQFSLMFNIIFIKLCIIYLINFH